MTNLNLKLTSINPGTLDVIGSFSVQTEVDVQSAVSKARHVQPEWQRLGFKERGRLLLKVRDAILKDMDALASLISKENGKPIVEAIGNDIMPVLDLITYFAKKSEKLLRREMIRLGKWDFLGRRSHLEYYPLGVVGVIAPWNFPFSIPVGEIVMALIVGNTVVFKPSEYTTQVGLKVYDLFVNAGLPKDILQIVTGDGSTGAALVKSGVNKIAFTGSVPTGKKIMAACADSLTPVTLELGGKDPFIVFEDANLEVASSAAVWGAFCNSGQVCASVERLYVAESVRDDFLNRVVEKTRAIRQGIGSGSDVDMGAMTAEMQIQKVSDHVEDARRRGAKILTGGERLKEFPGYFYKPTVLTNVDHSFAIVREESFGPILPVMTFRTEEEAIRLANDSDYALNAYVWTSDSSRAARVASQIVAGTVNINDSLFTHALPQTPWGGPKLSGIGRTHGALGLLDLVNVRHVHVNKVLKKSNFFWWYGYGPEKIEMFKTLSHMLFGSSLWSRAKAAVKFIRMSLKANVR